MRILTLTIILTMLSACTPYVEYQHLSDPRIDGDGYDLACAGLAHDAKLSLSGGICHNARGGDFVTFNARYTFKDKQ